MAKFHPLFRFMLLPVTLVLVGLLGLSTLVSAAPPSVTWSGGRNLSNSPERSVYTAVAADAAGYLHVAWLEYGPEGDPSSRLMYTNNIGGDFFGGYEVSGNAGKNKEHIIAIAVETNRVHLFYTGDNVDMRHRIVTLNGATPTREREVTTLSQGKGYAPTATVDRDGRVHAAWIDSRSGTYNVYHRIWAGGWEGNDRQVRSGELQTFPTIAATDDGRMHILYKSEDELKYSSFDGGQWRNSAGPQAGKPNQQWLTSDGSNLYAVWSVTVGLHQVRYSKYTNGSWSGPTTVSDSSRDSDFPAAFFSRANNKLYAIWAAGQPGVIQESIALREITPEGGMSDIVTIGGSAPSWPRGAAGPTTAGIAWQAKSSGDIVFVSATVRQEIPPTPTTPPPTATPTTPPPTATPTTPPSPTPIPGPAGRLMVAPKFTTLIGMPGTDPTLNVVVTSTGGPASTLRLDVDGTVLYNGAFTPDAEGRMTVPLTAALGKACERKVVTGVLEGVSGASAPFNTSIFVDGAVDASVEVRNPYLTGDQSSGNLGVLPNSVPNVGPVSGGEPGYTRAGYFFLNIRSRSDECAGLTSVSVDFESIPDGTINPPALPDEPIFVTGELEPIALPSPQEGVYTFKVTIKDRAGNRATYPDNGFYSIIGDSLPPVVTLSSTGPVPQQGGENGIATLTLAGLKVEDELYPTGTSNATNEYSGYWVIVKKQRAGEPSTPEWQRSGTVIRNKLSGSPPRLIWNVAFGMVGPYERTATYQVYVRFLDGAGNPSDRVIASVPFQVNEFQVTKVMLPMLTR